MTGRDGDVGADGSGAGERRAGAWTNGVGYRLVMALMTLSVCAFVLTLWLGKHTNIGNQSLRYVYGEPRRPFVYRVLVPSVVRTVVKPIPDADRRAVGKRLLDGHEWLGRCVAYLRVRPAFLVEYGVVLAIQFGSLVGFAWVIRRLFRALYQDEGPVVDVSVVVALLGLFPVYRRAGFIYDLPQLFLFSAALLALVRSRWSWYYPLIALGFLNKETTCLILVVFAAATWDRMPRRRFAVHVGLQALMFAMLRWLTVTLAGPGRPPSEEDNALRDYLLRNLAKLWQSEMFRSFTAMGIALFFLALVLRHYRRAPRFLRRATVLFPVLFAAFLKGGLWHEIRVLGEFYPVAFLLFWGGFLDLTGRPLTLQEDQAEPARLLEAHPGPARWVWIAGLLLVAVLFLVAALVGLGDLVKTKTGG